ncbi:MAG TPA: type VI secretion system protein TssA [Stellaceae bacterium]|jgi:type VI secretion system protein ImpA
MQEWPEGFDLPTLLAPIPGPAPAGTDLRQDASPDSLYFRLRDARGEARAAERASESGAEAGSIAEWRTVRELAIEALSQQTKDLEIAAWLSEALLRGDGLCGLAAGFRAMAGLAESFWDDFFPQPDEDGVAGRLAAVAGLNGIGRDGTLIQPLRRVVLFSRPDGAPFEFWQYEQSRETAGIGDAARRQQRLDAGVVPFETVESEARVGDPALFARLRDHATAAGEAWRALAQILDGRASADAPPTSQVRDLLDQIRQVADRFAPSAETAPEAAAALAALAAPSLGGGVAVSMSGTMATREDALRVLGDIAEFFRRTEPHSPLAYTLQEAVRRGRMTWPELLAEIVPDAASRSAILSSLGIRPPSD